MKRTAQILLKTPPVACLSLIASLGFLFQGAAQAETEKPKLFLQITFDQLRGDLPGRYLDRMGEGGFRYLLEKGLVYERTERAF